MFSLPFLKSIFESDCGLLVIHPSPPPPAHHSLSRHFHIPALLLAADTLVTGKFELILDLFNQLKESQQHIGNGVYNMAVRAASYTGKLHRSRLLLEEKMLVKNAHLYGGEPL